MVKLSRGGVCYNLAETPFLYEIEYDDHVLIYHFSSELYKNKFIESLENERSLITESLSNRFGFKVMNDLLSDIRLYQKIEKRGFLINADGRVLTCLNDIILDGKILIRKT